jgi:hypothetical protein
VLARIRLLAGKGLTSLMVLADFLSHRITPLQQHAHATWSYTGENDTTRLERGCGTDLET